MGKKAKNTDDRIKEMKEALDLSRRFIIITMIGLGYTPETCPDSIKEVLNKIDRAAGFDDKVKVGKNV